MKRFSDKKTQQIYEMRFADGIPEHVAIGAHKVMRLLVAACGWQDVGVIDDHIIRWPNAPIRYGLHVDGKWHVTFSWSNQAIVAYQGAYEILLERR